MTDSILTKVNQIITSRINEQFNYIYCNEFNRTDQFGTFQAGDTGRLTIEKLNGQLIQIANNRFATSKICLLIRQKIHYRSFMPKIHTHEFITDYDNERFQNNRDRLMKLVENDYKLIAWICWGFELLFKDLTYKQMFNYIGKVTEEELKEHIVPVDLEISADNASGVLFDRHYRLLELHVTTGYLVLENQLQVYPYEEIEARELVYFGSELFWEAEEIADKKHYRLITPPTFVWIFPEGPKKYRNYTNTFPIILPENRYQRNLNKNGSLEPEVFKPRFSVKSDICQFYLGNPENVGKDFLNDTNKAGKQTYVLLLLDLLFGFETDKETRIEMLDKIFNLKGKTVEEEVEIMNGFELWSKQRFNAGRDTGREEELEKNLRSLAGYLINQSKNEGRILTQDEALTKAQEILS